MYGETISDSHCLVHFYVVIWKTTELKFPSKILLCTWGVFTEEFLHFSVSFNHLLITQENVYILSVKITEGHQRGQHCPGGWGMKMLWDSWCLFHGVNYSGLLQSHTLSATISFITALNRERTKSLFTQHHYAMGADICFMRINYLSTAMKELLGMRETGRGEPSATWLMNSKHNSEISSLTLYHV